MLQYFGLNYLSFPILWCLVSIAKAEPWYSGPGISSLKTFRFDQQVVDTSPTWNTPQTFNGFCLTPSTLCSNHFEFCKQRCRALSLMQLKIISCKYTPRLFIISCNNRYLQNEHNWFSVLYSPINIWYRIQTKKVLEMQMEYFLFCYLKHVEK